MGCLQLRGVAKSIDVASMMYFNKRMAKMHIDHMENVEEELEFVRRTLCTSGGASLMQGGVAAQGRGLPQVAHTSLTSSQDSFAPSETAQSNFRTKAVERKSQALDVCTWADLKAEGKRRVAGANSVSVTSKPTRISVDS